MNPFEIAMAKPTPAKRPITCRAHCVFALLVAALCIGSTASHSAVTTLSGVDRISANSGDVRALRFTTSSTVFAGTQGGGLFRSADSGATWGRVAGFPAKYVWSIAQSADGTLFVASGEGLFKSTDGATGVTWTNLRGDHVRALAVSGSGTTALVLIGVQGAGIFRSNDGGATFQDFSSGLDSMDVRSLTIAGSDALAALSDIFFVDPQTTRKTRANVGGVFRAANAASAASWSNINSQGGATLDTKFVTAVVVDVAGTTYVGSRDPEGAGSGKVHRLVAGGAWTNPTVEAAGWLYDVEALAIDRTSPTVVWAGTRDQGVWGWTGSSWARRMVIMTDPDLLTGVMAIATPPSGTTVVVGTKGIGTMYSAVGASPWTIGTGIAADRVMAWTSHDVAAPNTYYIGLRNGGVMKSSDAGVSWTQMNAGVLERLLPVLGVPSILTANAVAANPSSTSELYVAFEGYPLHKFNGSSWSVPPEGQPSPLLNPQSLVYTGSATALYSDFAFSRGIYRRNGANPWTLRQAGPFSGAGIGSVHAGNASGRYFGLSFDAMPYVSNDAGATWLQVPASAAPSSGFMRLAFQALADKPSQPSTLLGSTNKGLYRSSDGGASFTRISANGLGSNLFTGLAYSSSNIAWGATRDGALYCSTDDGANWVSVTQPFPAVVTELFARGSTLFLLTDGAGMLRRSGATCP
jgi:photosystem II stability/assembly factor-like uncharacterized protein